MIVRSTPTTGLYRWLTASAAKVRRSALLVHLQSENRRLRLERDQAHTERDTARASLAERDDAVIDLRDLVDRLNEMALEVKS